MAAPVVRQHNDGRRTLDLLTWGLVPFFSKEAVLGRLINARSEEAATKPSFRAAFQRRRCLVPASGFYEWRALEGSKVRQPYYFRPRGGDPFFFAGLWEYWKPKDGQGEALTTFTVLTTRPNELAARIHNRMPVIVPPERFGVWLDNSVCDRGELNKVLEPYPAERIEAYPVSTRVNSPKNDGPELTEPIGGSE
jgi:putative SOS response-associated peptidase YedK